MLSTTVIYMNFYVTKLISTILAHSRARAL